jgi:hypothetical protein
MGRHSIFKKPMTPKQRQQRRRDKLKREAETLKRAHSRARRAASRAAPEIEPVFATGDCRTVLPPLVSTNSAALVLADPYWPDWLVEPAKPSPFRPDEGWASWVGEFAERILIPNGSLLCWIGSENYLTICNTIVAAGEGRLFFKRPLAMEHDAQRLIRGDFVRCGACFIAWFMKAPARRRAFSTTENGETKLITPTVQNLIKGATTKELHEWSQGDAAWQWIEPLTAPGELVVDLFSGSGEWGWIAAGMGRRYIGVDVGGEGGSTACAMDNPNHQNGIRRRLPVDRRPPTEGGAGVRGETMGAPK